MAWVGCVLFQFLQYALRSAPGVVVPELTTTFGLSALGVSALVGNCFKIIQGYRGEHA